MKHLLTAIAIITLFTSQSCNSGQAETKKVEFKAMRPDTVMTFAFVMADVDKLGVQPIHVMRIIKDSFTVVKIDTVGTNLVAERKWRRDTLYFYPSQEIVKINGVTLKAKDGRDSVGLFYRQMPNVLVLQDFNKRFK